MGESCIFCLIARGQDQEAEVIKQSKDLVCFRDICPAAPHHYLVIPRNHIESILSLNRRHVSLVERMAQMGKAALQEQGITDMTDIRLGFHQPPFISVNHLHLHVLAPASQITDLEYKFIPQTVSFVEVRFSPNMNCHPWLVSGGQSGPVKLNCLRRSFITSNAKKMISEHQAQFNNLYPS